MAAGLGGVHVMACSWNAIRPEDIENNRHVINGQVYVWIVRVRNLDGKPFVYKGTITVL